MKPNKEPASRRKARGAKPATAARGKNRSIPGGARVPGKKSKSRGAVRKGSRAADSPAKIPSLASAYAGPLVEIHERLHADDDDVLFWVELARASGAPVLELGCGAGRIGIALARAGLEVWGLDASGDMLALYRERLENEPPAVQARVHLAQGHFDDFALQRRFAFALFSSDTFCHLVGTDIQLAALARIREHLEPGGRLAVDISTPEPADMLAASDEEQIYEFPADDGEFWRLHLTPRVNLRLGMVSDLIQVDRVAPGGKGERVVESQRARADMAVLFARELALVLRAAGFAVERRYGDYRGLASSGDDGRLICVATAR